jgi:MOSC domain-containing protein YiiM
MAHLVAVNKSERREDPKVAMDEGDLVAGYGLVGDSHAGLSEREVSLVALESVQAVNCEHDLDAGPGSFADNLTTEGIDLLTLKVGDHLCVGPALLEVVQIGKPRSVAHTYNYKGVSILPDVGVFCRILESGRVKRGDPIEVIVH